ncbi:MAG TPA: ATP-dependent DNA helicase RecQ [Spirochaetota bacterium]
MKVSDQSLYSTLKNSFGIDEFRGSQKEIIIRTLDGKNSLVMMPTGMGKSLCYQLPALILPGLTIVISPLISLMKDQVDALVHSGIDAAFINSSLGKSQRLRRYDDIREGKYKLLYVAPERFRNDDFLNAVRFREISLVVLDEAHCVSQWGNDFRPDYSRVGEFVKILGNPPLIALTATATGDVQKDIIDKTGIDPREFAIFNDGVCRPNLFLEVAPVIDTNEKYELIFERLKKRKGTSVVYFNLISGIDKFSEYLDTKGLRHSIYHGKLDPTHRRNVQTRFMRADNQIMLATNAFGMGIDKPDIRMIIHAEIPDSVESYYQEIGRAGRDGKKSDCLLVYCEDDLAVQIGFLEWRNPDASFITNTHRLLSSLGNNVNSLEYDDIQEKLVHKNRGDHRLQTVLNLFDLYGVTTGNLDVSNLKVVSDIPAELIAPHIIKEKFERDRQRLVQILSYAKSTTCRREMIHDYFGMKIPDCENCDNCLT